MNIDSNNRVKWKSILKLLAVALIPLISQPAAAASIRIIESEVSVGLSYLMGWSSVVFDDSATAQSDGSRPIVMMLGGVNQVPDYLGQGPQRVQADLTASGSLAVAMQTGVAPSFFATTSSSIAVMADGTRASAGGFAPADENYAFYNFEVSGSPVDYSLSYTRPSNGVLSFSGPNTNITLADSTDMIGTLQPGFYNINAFHSQIAIAGSDTAMSESGFTFAITFDESTTVVPLPAAAWLFGTSLFGLLGIAKRKQMQL